MKVFYTSLAILFLLSSCKRTGKAPVQNNNIADSSQLKKTNSFFPVTNYLQGQIVEIRGKGVNPLKYTTNNGKTDSGWIKVETLENELTEFLNPVIDSVHMYEHFTETSFLDQTINAITLTYDPVKKLPDSIQFTHWDIYIDPEKNTVQKIYLVKRIAPNKIRQLTWQSGKQCRAITVVDDPDGKARVEDEVIYKWNF